MIKDALCTDENVVSALKNSMKRRTEMHRKRSAFYPPFLSDVVVVVVVVFCFFLSVDVVNSYGWNKIVRSSVSSQTDDATHQHRFFCLSQLCGEKKNGSKIKKEEESLRKIRIRTPIVYSSVSSRFRADRKRNNCIREDSREEKCVARLYSRIATTGEASARMRV